jgi:HD-GYP domain-containing protein (c-di-GMP phosphodiesterase class II)
MAARIFSVVDVWDAMLVDRPYRKRFQRADVISYIEEQQGLHFDPQVAEAFLGLVAQI